MSKKVENSKEYNTCDLRMISRGVTLSPEVLRVQQVKKGAFVESDDYNKN